MAKFIKSYHFDNDKLSDSWCLKVANEVYYNGGCISPLAGKNINEIEQYSSGKIDMKPFIKMFKSSKRKLEKAGQDTKGLEDIEQVYNAFQPLPLIPVKFNSAVQLVHKTGFDISVKAIDTLASEKREKDIDFLENRQYIQNLGQELSAQLGQGDFDAGATSYSADKFREIPLGLDLKDSLERSIFIDIVYKLMPEAAYETILQVMYDYQQLSAIDLLEVQDTFKYGVCGNCVKVNGITGLPTLEYLDLTKVFIPKSKYPDYRDNSERMFFHNPTIMDLFNLFGKEIGDEKSLSILVDDYATDNGFNKISRKDWGSSSIKLIEFQVISIDGLYFVENKSGNKRFIPDGENIPETSKGIFGQNTYIFYWVFGTKYFFGKEKLGFAYRKQGNEAFCIFPSNIYKSQEKSAVEQCIGENKKAILADVKLQHAILKAKSTGAYINMKYLTNAANHIKSDNKSPEEIVMDLLDLYNEDNIMMGSSEGFDGATEGQFQPVMEIPGGLKNDINGYLLIMQQAASNISKWTGINDDLAGLNDNARSLNGARKLNITYGMNSINYAYEARLSQYKKVFNVMSWYIKYNIEKGGALKKSIEQLIGNEKVEALEGLGSIKDHQFFINIGLGMREEEAQYLATNIAIMEQRGQLKRIERLIIEQKTNIKDASLLLAAIEHKFEKKQAMQQEQMFTQQQQLQQQRGESQLAVSNAEKEGKKELVYAQGDVAAKLMDAAQQLSLTDKQMEAVLKQRLQQDRLNAGLAKESIKIDSKQNLVENQEIKSLI